MKFIHVKDKNGNPVGFKTYESAVYDSKGINMITKITNINEKMDYVNSNLGVLQNRINELTGGALINPFKGVTKRENPEENICLLSDNKGVVTSEYGYTYDIIVNGLDSGKFSDYLKDGDWIELTTNDGATYKMYANIDTYYGEGEDEAHKIGHHIDFISDNLIYGSTSRTSGKDTYSKTNINSWRMNNDESKSSEGYNNGKSTETSPFLANSNTHRGSQGGIIDKLDAYYNNNIPDSLKGYIIKKYHKVPTRYSTSSSYLTDDNGSKWAEMPYLWIPYEKEVYGSNKSTKSLYESDMKQYHSFANISNFKVKADKKDTSSSWYWWVASAFSGDYKTFYYVLRDGAISNNQSYYWNVGVPLCFRLQKKDMYYGITRDVKDESNICLLKDNKGVVTSDYGYNYTNITNILDSGEYAGYLRDGDWIELTTNDGATYKMYANIDTYYGEGEDEAHKIGHHIDFISDNLIYGSVGVDGNYNSEANSWRMRDTTLYKTGKYGGTNNGSDLEGSPFLASTKKYKSDGWLIDKLETYYSDNLPDSIKSVMVKKYHKVPIRQNPSSSVTSYDLTDDTGTKWEDMGYLWLPYEREVFGSNKYANSTYESHMKQYHSFANITDFKNKYDTKYSTSSTCFWWNASAKSGDYDSFCRVSTSGEAINYFASYWNTGVPLCFRLQKRDIYYGLERDLEVDDNICLLKDNNGVVTSDYGYDYETLANVLDSGDYSAYIKDGDWIELTLANGDYFKLYANIDTYYGEGPDDAHKIGHHIDFISKDLIPGSVGADGVFNSKADSWRMRDTSLYQYGTNNGSNLEGSPFLASTKKYKSDGVLIDKLEDYYTKLPDGLKSFIVKKYHNVPIRQNSSSSATSYDLTDDTGTEWKDMGYLWLPYEKEVNGSNTYANSTYESHMKQYHSFANITDFKKKYDTKYGTDLLQSWWNASASGDYYQFCHISRYGNPDRYYTYCMDIGAPLCFRFQKTNNDEGESTNITASINRTTTSNICLLSDNNGVVTSDYGYTYENISELLKSGNFNDKIKDGDWIELTASNGDYFKLYANVDTYYGQGDNNKTIGHHIDFISKDLIPGSVGVSGTYNSEADSWRMRDDTILSTGTNNGSVDEGSPFLASTKDYKKDGNLIDKLNNYYASYLPISIKEHIVKKYHNVPIRKTSDSDDESYDINNDHATIWEDMGYLWLPYEKEVHGSNTYANSTYESHMVQYHSFANITDFKKKYDTKYSTNSTREWWTASAYSGGHSGFCHLRTDGSASSSSASTTYYGVPLCFRFQ